MGTKKYDIDGLINDFNHQDRRALSAVITYIESEQDDHQDITDKILAGIEKPKNDILTLAVSGPPGVGKSTFINALGKIIVDKNYRLAVLAIDPSSEISGGSILADKTRMTHLLKMPEVFIRPTPSRGTLGGITLTSKDVLYALASFGFDFIMLETVGVGQSETLAKALADHFVVLMQPGAGDELQGMKKGILETADFILVNKTDGDQEKLALHSKSYLKSTLPKSNANGAFYIDAISAQTGRGLMPFFEQVLRVHEGMLKDGTLDIRRKKGLERIVQNSFQHLLIRHLQRDKQVAQKIQTFLTQMTQENTPLGPGLHGLVKGIIADKLSRNS